ncbi:hypothetical protein [Spirochaeta isovalerica]|uniref:Uncharacterized protein n=1 Tax=Spirochaeta isovalerica TaxID=150 RepID=A0A841R4S7_9SPIO|nr:hypothetical protein [Spirochaeta isovalerica]MBB6478401.1 hypothetical protein [Spirochaeta isovalerica]
MPIRKAMLISVSLIFILSLPLFSQDEVSESGTGGLDFGFGLAIGAVNLIDENGNNTVYNSIKLNPDLAIGKFGIGLDIDFRFTMDTSNGDSGFRVYKPDWVLEDGSFSEYLNLYLSKFDYIRWGQSGDDLFAKIGSLENVTVGNGFIVGGYTNEMFKPAKKYTGLRFELDTALFNWPYMGIELFTSNISVFDLMAARYYVKPLGGIKSPVFSGLEIGATIAVDRKPYFFLYDEATVPGVDTTPDEIYDYTSISVNESPNTVLVYGFDVMQPLVDIKVFTMALYGDFVLQGTQTPALGGTSGLNGSLFKFIGWNAGLIFRGEDFVPTYFNRNYDLDRLTKYYVYNNNGLDPDLAPAGIDYNASLGFNFMDGGISFVTQISGPFAAPTKPALEAPLQYPHLMALFTIAEGIIPYFDMSFWYDKQGIDEFAALVSAENALIGGRLNFRMEPAVISLQVDVKYDPAQAESWDVTTKLETGIQF